MSKDNMIRWMQDDAIINVKVEFPSIVETLNFHKPLQTASIKLPAVPPTKISKQNPPDQYYTGKRVA